MMRLYEHRKKNSIWGVSPYKERILTLSNVEGRHVIHTDKMFVLCSGPAVIRLPGVVCFVRSLLHCFSIYIYGIGISSMAAGSKFGADNTSIGGNEAARGSGTMRGAIGQTDQGGQGPCADDGVDDLNDNDGGGGDSGNGSGSADGGGRGDLGGHGGGGGGGHGNLGGHGGGGGDGGGDGDGSGDGSGDDDGGNDGDDDGDEEECVASTAKTFEFYQKNNSIGSAQARQDIKTIYFHIQAQEHEYTRTVERNLPNKARAALARLGVLKRELLLPCKIYATKTKYYQHGDLGSMPSCWWAQSSKEGINMYYKHAKHIEFVKQVMARQMCAKENDEFFEAYECECSKWYANLAQYRDSKPRDVANTWMSDSCSQLPPANNDKERLQRFEKHFFPVLLEGDHVYPRSPSKRGPVCKPRIVRKNSPGPTVAGGDSAVDVVVQVKSSVPAGARKRRIGNGSGASHKKGLGQRATAAWLAKLAAKSAAQGGGVSIFLFVRSPNVMALFLCVEAFQDFLSCCAATWSMLYFEFFSCFYKFSQTMYFFCGCSRSRCGRRRWQPWRR